MSITDSSFVASELVSGPKQVSGIYLLGLARKHGGRLVTLDRTIAIQAAVGATKENIVIV